MAWSKQTITGVILIEMRDHGKIMKDGKMFKKILFATDFSAASADAIEVIKQLKQLGTEEIVVLTVVRDKYSYLWDEYSQIDLEELSQSSINVALKKLETLSRELMREGFKIKALLSRGVPFCEILKMEQKEDISLIVLGSHRRRCFQQMFLGSVSAAVIRKANHPVLVVAANNQYLATKQINERAGIATLLRSS
jgi:nucleotide-binding universal stress UspA family protein